MVSNIANIWGIPLVDDTKMLYLWSIVLIIWVIHLKGEKTWIFRLGDSRNVVQYAKVVICIHV